MARKGLSRMELRRQAEAVEAQQADGAEPAKATKAKKAAGEKVRKAPAKGKKSKDRPTQRKRLVWVVYSPSMKEEGRFAYDQRTAAEERLETLKQKHKKPYFIQPVKEVISDGSAPVAALAAAVAVAEPEIDETEAEPELERMDDEEAELDEEEVVAEDEEEEEEAEDDEEPSEDD